MRLCSRASASIRWLAISCVAVTAAAGCDKADQPTSYTAPAAPAAPAATTGPTGELGATVTRPEAPKATPERAAATKPDELDTSTWDPEIKRIYGNVLKLPAERVADISKQVRQLATKGLKAKPALEALAGNPELPEPHRAIPGLVLADLYAFDKVALKRLATHSNIFAQSAALRQLATHGGADLRKQLQVIVASKSALGSHTKRIVDAMPDAPKASEAQLARLRQIQLTPKSPSAIAASAKLVVDESRVADWGARKIVSLNGVSSDAAMLAAVMLSRVHAKNYDTLVELTDRKQNKFVRYEAFKKLALLGERGLAVIRAALDGKKKEPLKPQLERLLKKPAASTKHAPTKATK